jgi:hypothetical protein
MAHKQQHDFIRSVRERFQKNFTDAKVLELGSLDINGSVRNFFVGCNYIGIDVGEGKGVDVVCEGQKYAEADESFDTTISCECFEHNPFWKETFVNMIRLTKQGGLVTFTCATTGRHVHGTSISGPDDSPLSIGIGWEYYKNLTEFDFRVSVDIDKTFSSYSFSICDEAHDIYFWGIKQ